MRSFRLQLLVLLGLAASSPACNLGSLFESSGAPCLSDANCPDAQVCCDGHCSSDCNRAGTNVLSASLATDFVPGYEFDKIAVELASATRTIDVNAVTELVNPRPIAQFPEIASGDHRVVIKLLRFDSVVAQRAVTFAVTGDMTVPVILTRDCEGVTCTGAADQCLNGLCVNSACSELNPDACPVAMCAQDDDCAATVTCTHAVCIGGRCLERREDGLCESDERCIPGIGCVVAAHECDYEMQCDDLTTCTQERCTDGRCTSQRDDTRCDLTICDPTAKTANAATGCTPAPCSADNCLPAPCETATCENGSCVHTPVCESGQQCCDGVCAINCDDPRACAGRPGGYVCRVSVGACDVPETCDGVSDACPPDARVPGGSVCRAAAGGCDIAELCDGQSPLCPANVVAPSGSVCRAKNGACDVAEACNGQSSACPVDVFELDTTVCRSSAGVCDPAEMCTGSSSVCPGNAYYSNAVACRPSAGDCDIPETCTGGSPACPANELRTSSYVCRGSQGACDRVETCTGGSAVCPGDSKQNAGTVCRGIAGACDVAETCNGSSNTCPGDSFTPGGIACRGSAGPCDPPEYCPGSGPACPGDSFTPGGTLCRGASGDPCDVADYCTGGGAACPDNAQPAGTLCQGAPNSCYQNRVCNGSPVCPGWTPSPYGTYYGEIDTCRYYICDGAFGATIAPRNNGAYCADGGTCLYYVCNNGACNAGVARNEGAACDGGSCAFCSGGSCAYPNCEHYGGCYYCYYPGQGATYCGYACGG
ncbi:MAG: hypothetical protein ACAI38_03805 [Myxococcota bacterium]